MNITELPPGSPAFSFSGLIQYIKNKTDFLTIFLTRYSCLEDRLRRQLRIDQYKILFDSPTVFDEEKPFLIKGHFLKDLLTHD
jgi:hypothetical protein